jgi:hypothetical protein
MSFGDITIKDYSSGREPEGQTWNTEELQRDFEVFSFSAPYITVRRKSDGQMGTLEFVHRPRVYWDFQPGNRLQKGRR